MLLTLQVATSVGVKRIVDMNGSVVSDEWGILRGS
jgi:hypothetical protein